jgi:hypothetical protein
MENQLNGISITKLSRTRTKGKISRQKSFTNLD